MHSNLIIALGLLAAPVLAGRCEKGGYKSNQCLWAARDCVDECSAFLRATVTPCPSTRTTIKTVTKTNLAVSSIVTSIVTGTDFITTPVTVTSVTTIEDTATVTVSSEVDVTSTVDETKTATVTDAPSKRAVSYRPLPQMPDQDDGVQARSPYQVPAAPSVCRASTSHPSKVPRSASACRDKEQFSSACSCAGVRARTTTLPRRTTTVTQISTVHATPTVTATTVVTSLTSVTVAQTTVVPSTFETTDATTVITELSTVTATVTDVVSETVTVEPACTAYNFVDAGTDSFSGQFLTGQEPDTSSISYGFVSFTSDPTKASPFTLRSDGRVYGNNIYGWTTEASETYYVLQMTDNSQSNYGIQSVICSISDDSSIYTGAIGVLSCTVEGTPVSLGSCVGIPDGDLIQFTADDTCTAATLAVIPVAC